VDGVQLKTSSASAVAVKSREKLTGMMDKTLPLKTVMSTTIDKAFSTDNSAENVKSKSSVASMSVIIKASKNVTVSKLPKRRVASEEIIKDIKTAQQVENDSNVHVSKKKRALSEAERKNEKFETRDEHPSDDLQSGELLLLPHAILELIDNVSPCDLSVGDKIIRVSRNQFHVSPAGCRIVLPVGSLPELYLRGHRVPLRFSVSTRVVAKEPAVNVISVQLLEEKY